MRPVTLLVYQTDLIVDDNYSVSVLSIGGLKATTVVML